MNTRDAVADYPYAIAGRLSTAGAARTALGATALLGLMLVGACTSTQSQIEPGAATLPRPQVVIVDTFAASPDEVKLDEGLSAEIEQAIKEKWGTSRTEQELQAGRQVTDAIADQLVVEIRDMGLSAERGSAVPPGTQNAVLIKGQLVSIDEGNRTKRVLIGLGAGRSDVRTQVQVYEFTPAGSRLIDTIEVDAKSGLALGMAETMGVGALTGHLLVSTMAGGGLHVADEPIGANLCDEFPKARTTGNRSKVVHQRRADTLSLVLVNDSESQLSLPRLDDDVTPAVDDHWPLLFFHHCDQGYVINKVNV
jgi:Domain of unknown function (DUF4410)